MFCSPQVSAVIASQAAALGAVHGASRGTVWAIWSIAGSVTVPSWITAAGSSAGGIVPVYGVPLPFSYHSRLSAP